MSVELLDLLKELRGDFDRIGGEAKTRFVALEASIDDLYKRLGRPGSHDLGDTDIRKSAIDWCVQRKQLTTPKIEGNVTTDYTPSGDEINEAIAARRGLKNLFRKRDANLLDPLEKKSLSSFSFGSNDFLLAPEMSNRVLSCLVDPTDLAAIMGQAQTSSGSLRFLIDNARTDVAGWACEASCFANNPQPDLQEGLGELEIKAESLRFIVCAGNDLLADSSFNVEAWVLQKVSNAFRRKISEAVIGGSGVGMPQGILTAGAGIPICDTAPSTAAGQFTWQDLVMLKYEIPMQWQAGGSYIMNQRTFAFLITMSDASGRPLIGTLANAATPGFGIFGTPIQIVTQMPDVAPGATPVAYGDWRQAYLIVTRQATNMISDPYSAAWCTLFRFSTRVGGSTVCPNAARLLRIR